MDDDTFKFIVPKVSRVCHLIDMIRPGQPCIEGHPQDKGRYRPTGLASRRDELVGVSGYAYWP